MGLLSSLLGSNKNSSSTSTSQSTKNDVYNPVVGGAIDGMNVQGEGNTVNVLDGGALSLGRDIVTSALDANAMQLDTVVNAVNNVTERSIDTIDSALLSNKSTAELALMSNADVISTASLALADANANMQSLSDSAMSNNVALADKAIDSVSFLASDYSKQLADSNTRALDFADAQNALLVDSLTSNANTTQDALIQLATLQERGLDNALTVASNVSMDDAAEASQNIVKYVMLGLGVVGVAVALKR